MRVARSPLRRSIVRHVILMIPLLMLIGLIGPWAHESTAAEGDAPPAPSAEDSNTEADRAANAALQALEPDEDKAEEKSDSPDADAVRQISYYDLAMRGGWFMVPIGLMSMLVVVFGMERLLALRRAKVVPRELITGLGNLAGQQGGLDPRKAYRLCQQYPSAAANVIRSMLLKIGRPHSEVEHAVSEANDREAARLFSNVRWLTLAAAISPLLGLLGTVGGMIMAFFDTANLAVGANKSQELADGIYVALVTTFAGLLVAIPAAVLAHFFEGRIQTLFRELDETLLGLMPQMERFEGRMRVSKDHRRPRPKAAPIEDPIEDPLEEQPTPK